MHVSLFVSGLDLVGMESVQLACVFALVLGRAKGRGRFLLFGPVG